jgi:tetratricopeptide (TPR) repeat protein
MFWRRSSLALVLTVALCGPAVAAPKKKQQQQKTDDSAAKVQKLTPSGPQLQYEAFRKRVETKVAQLREEQIAKVKRLLELGPPEKEVPDIKFRLAELYFEKSRYFFFQSQEADDKIPNAKSPGEKDGYEAEKKKNQKESKSWARQSTDIYKEIRDKYPKYERMPEVLFALGQSLWSDQQYQAAIEVYADLIRNYKDSQYVAEAWVAFGEYYFNEGDVHKALKSYEKAAEDKKARVYGFALYKQGWCYYNLSDWKKALKKFEGTVAYSQMAEELSGENKIALGREAQKDYVRTYAHIGDANRAKFDFASLLGKENCDSKECLTLLESLAGIWFDDGYFDESAYIYTTLIKLNPTSTKNPYYQGRIVDLVSRGGDKQKVVNEVKRLVEVYNQTKDFVAKMPADAKDLEAAKNDVKEAAIQAESTVRKLAQIWNQEAKKTHQNKTYDYAMNMYAYYLQLFPSSKFAYEMHFQLGDLYYKLEKFDEAAKEYEWVVKADPKGQYLVEAANDNILAVEEHLKDLKIPRPKSAEKPQEIHKEKMRLIEACDRYVQFVPADKADKLVAVKFKVAKIYYDYSHFEEAVKRFDDIATNHPDAKEAEYAANLVIDTFNIKQDWRNLYDFAARYLKIEALLKDREKLEHDLRHYSEYTKFKLVQILEEDVKKNNGDWHLVAQGYEDFYREFPKSENADKALFNSSVAWDKVGETKKADEMRKKLMNEYKDSELGADVTYYIAKRYEQKTAYKKAAQMLAAFVKKYPNDKRVRDALFNAAVFYVGVGDVKEGNKLREEYLAKYGKLKEGEKEASSIYYSIARDLELAGRWTDAAKRYEDFTKNFPKSPQVWDALHNESAIRRDKLRQTTQADKLDGTILGTYESAKRKGAADVPPQAALYASLIAFQRIDKDYNEYKKLKIKAPNVKDPKPFQRSVEDKAKAREKLIKEYTAIVTRYQQADSTIASMYRIAEAWDEFIQAIVGVPCPRGLPQEVCSILKEEFEKMVAQPRESAMAAYKTCVNKSNELNTFTVYSTKCVKALEALAPASYSPIVERQVAYSQSEKMMNLQSNGLMLGGGGSATTLPQREGGGSASDSKKPKLARGSKAKGEKGEPAEPKE